MQGTRPLGAIILVKFQFLTPKPISVKFGMTEVRSSLPNFTVVGTTCRQLAERKIEKSVRE